MEHHGLVPIHIGNGIANELLPYWDVQRCAGLCYICSGVSLQGTREAQSQDGLGTATSNPSCLDGCKEVQMGHRVLLHQTEEEMEEKLV